MKNDKAVGGAGGGPHGAFGRGHEAGDVALAVADSGDIANCAVGITATVVGTLASGVTENDLAILFQISECGFVAMIISVGVRDGDLEDLALLRGGGERRVPLFRPEVH